MTNYNRLSSIDISRGVALLLMLFVNDLNIRSFPFLPELNPAVSAGPGIADWVFPLFLFIAGLVIPFSFSKRISAGEDTTTMTKHIIKRSVSLLIIGVLMLNSRRLDPELTGLGRNIWSLLMFLGIFLVWNDYRSKENRFFTVTTLRLAGMALLVFLVFKFKSGQPENDGSLVTGWWGFTGLIGWGYLVSAYTYITCRDSLIKTSVVTAVFLILNLIAGLGVMKVSGILSMVFGVIINGYVPFIMLSGLITGLVIRNISEAGSGKTFIFLSGLGISYLAVGFIIRYQSIISDINLAAARALISCGISILSFILIYWIADIRKYISRASFLRPAAEHSLTAYLASYLIYYLILISGVPVLIYKQSPEPFVVAAGSLAWSILIILLTAFLVRLNIRLKL